MQSLINVILKNARREILRRLEKKSIGSKIADI